MRHVQECFAVVGSTLYFQAGNNNAGNNGVELWKSDGTFGGTVPVKDINPGAGSSSPGFGTLFGGEWYFRADDGALVAAGGHAAAVSALAFSPASDRLLSGARDFTARIWEFDRAQAGRPLREASSLTSDNRPVRAVAFNAAGTLCATAAGDDNGLLRVYDCADDGAKRALYEQRVGKAVKQIAFLPGDRELLARTSRRAIVWSVLRSRGATALQQPGKVEAIAFVGDERRLVSTGDDERLRMWDRRDGRLVWETEQVGLPIERLAVAPSGERIAIALVDGTLALHAAADGRRLDDLPSAGGNVRALRFLSEGSLLTAGASRDGGHVAVWDLQTRARDAQIELPDRVTAAAVSPAGDVVATIPAGGGPARLWRLPDLSPLGEVGAPDTTYRAVAFGPSGAQLLLCDDAARAQRFLLDGTTRATFSTDGDVQHASYSEDGQFLLTCSRAGTAQLWRCGEDAKELDFEGHLAPLRCGALSRDGSWAATSARDGSIWIWPTDPVEVAERLPSNTEQPRRGR